MSKREWHIEQRFGRFYPVDQFGGFTRQFQTEREAVDHIDHLVELGDRWADQ